MPQELEKLVHAEQVRSVYRQSMTVVLSHPMAAALLAWVFKDIVEHRILFKALTGLYMRPNMLAETVLWRALSSK